MSTRGNKKLKVLMAAVEVAPLAKVGGLADVVGGLPKELNKIKCDARVVMPKYGSIDVKKYGLRKIIDKITVPAGKKKIKISVWETGKAIKGVKVYLIEEPKMFGQDEVYHGNNSERFLFFSSAILHTLPKIDFQPDVIHCHDYHTALITDLVKVSNKYSGYLKNVKTLYTIHNLNYQGLTDTEVLNIANLKIDYLSALSEDAKDGDINFMSQGIMNADWINTVSPTYSKEIKHSSFGASLEKIIQAHSNRLSGILNGIDEAKFNPATDKNIYKKYNSFFIGRKLKNKTFLQKKLGLPADENKAVVGLVSRLAWQKGLEMLTEDVVQKSNCQFIVLGEGEDRYEKMIKSLANKYPDKFSSSIKYDEELASQIYAGVDIFIMPSRYEPCGLGQMIAMRYGTLPVVRATGGLADTVDNKVGFKFNDFKASEFKKALTKALNTYYNKPEKWREMMKTAMKRDFSWKDSAEKYVELYNRVADSSSPHSKDVGI